MTQPPRVSFFGLMQRNALYFAWVIALIGFCVSVFYGEILGNPPCTLCWYQRISLFPLVILLGIAAYRGESMILPYVMPIVFLGGCVAIFHLLQPYVPLFQKANVCRLAVPCTQTGFSFFFPFLSAIGFFFIALFLLIEWKSQK
jgi:disulfide bond formation protein DsbB